MERDADGLPQVLAQRPFLVMVQAGQVDVGLALAHPDHGPGGMVKLEFSGPVDGLVDVGLAPHRARCRIARDLIADKEYAIADLLAAYQSPEGDIPILPHPRCDRLNQEVVEHCCCRWRLLPKEIPGVDPKFKAWLDEQVAASNKKIGLLGEQAAAKRLRLKK